MTSLTMSLYFGAGILSGTLISIFINRKTKLYDALWNQIKRPQAWLNTLQWFVLTLFVVAVFLGFSSLLNPSVEVRQLIIGFASGLMMAYLPTKDMK